MEQLTKLFSWNKKTLWFVILFALLGLGALQIPLTHLVGSKATFTVFDAFAPIAGGFLGATAGAISVLLMELANFAVHGFHVVDAGTFIRFLPPLFAALYFGKKTKLNIIVPALAIIAFVANPIGRTVWYFSLYWLIPIICYFLRDRFLFARSLGATFSAHAVGGALWIWVFHLPAAVWMGLIPIVAIERITFALGTSVMYVAFTNLFRALEKRGVFAEGGLSINPKYVLRFVEHRTR